MIRFNNLTNKVVDTAPLIKLGTTILREEGIEEDEDINCLFTDNEYIKALNKKYRARNNPTDILTFSFNEGSDSEYRGRMFGEIYISLEEAEANAVRFKQELEDEIKLLFVHGLLHLLGYGDENKKERLIMRSKENYFLSGK